MNVQSDYQLREQSLQRLEELVESVGVHRFAGCMGLSTRQINRILCGAQPNPVERIIRCLQSATPEAGDKALDFICQEMGGHFVRHAHPEESMVNAVRECAEAIAAISDGEICDADIRDVREAISALSAVIMGKSLPTADGHRT